MSQFLVRLVLIVGIGFVLACLGQAVPFQLVFFLAFGWARFLYRVLPQVRVDRLAVVTSLVCLALLTFGVHRFASWLYRQTQSPAEPQGSNARRWPWRWTAWLIGGVLLMFVAGLATVGVSHQVAWLLTAPEKLVNSGAANAAARRAQSTNNLKQVGIGMHAYLRDHEAWPPAATMDRMGRPLYGWQSLILRYIGHEPLQDRINFQLAWDEPGNAGPYQTPVNEYLRPGIVQQNDARGYALSHIAGNVALLGGDVPRTPGDVSDGDSNTILVGEVKSNFKPWGDPINWRDPALGINRVDSGFGSIAPGGANFLFVDGSVHFLKDKIDPRVLKALGTPAGGEQVGADQY